MAKTKKKSVEVPLLTPQPMEVEKKKVKRAMEDARTPASYKKAKTMKKVVSAIEDNKPFKKTKLKGKKKVIPKFVHAKTGKISRNVSKHDDDSGDLEEELPLPKAKKSVISKVAMAASSSEEDESDGGESCEEEPVSKPVITNGSKANSKASSHGVFETPESGSDEESDDESEEEKPVAKICASSKVAKKTESSDDDEDDESEEEDDDEGDESEEEPSKLLQGKEQITAISESSDNSDETDEEESDEEEPVGKKQKTVIHTPHKTREDIAGSTTVFVKNLAWAVTEDTIHEFFGKDITDVRLATDDTGRFKGFGHVEFKNEAAAKKAVQKSGHKFLGREIFCELARERGTQGAEKGDWKSPQSGGYKSNATPGGFRSGNDTTAFVKGFDKFQDEDTIRKELIEFFGECGKVNNVRVPTDRETQQIKGFAYLEFVSSDALSKALELNGQELNGRCLVVDEASQPSGDSGSGRGRGGRGRGFGGRGRGFGDRGRGGFGGRGRGGFRGGDRGRGGRGGRGDGSRHKHSGRKTTFGDE